MSQAGGRPSVAGLKGNLHEARSDQARPYADLL